MIGKEVDLLNDRLIKTVQENETLKVVLKVLKHSYRQIESSKLVTERLI